MRRTALIVFPLPLFLLISPTLCFSRNQSLQNDYENVAIYHCATCKKTQQSNAFACLRKMRDLNGYNGTPPRCEISTIQF